MKCIPVVGTECFSAKQVFVNYCSACQYHMSLCPVTITEEVMDMENSLIGKIILVYRHLRKLTQAELAEKSYLSTNYVGMIERGERIPSLQTFLYLCEILEVPLMVLLPNPDPHKHL